MADTLSESSACALLARLFRQRGYAIERNFPFEEFGVSFDCDGWDRAARVGFEFLSSQHADHDDLSLAEFEALMDAQARGRLQLLVLDESEALSRQELTALATEFLDGLAAPSAAAMRRGGGRSAPARRAAKAEKRPPAKRAAAGKPTAARGAKPGGKRPVATKGRPVGTGATRQRPAEQPAGGLRVRGTRVADARGRRGTR
ncbi:MAG: hypothetical protein KGQ61_07850 [Planctomycetes bacterium]|nr:hypothetical protein [Planctomycetota bacterium]